MYLNVIGVFFKVKMIWVLGVVDSIDEDNYEMGVCKEKRIKTELIFGILWVSNGIMKRIKISK